MGEPYRYLKKLVKIGNSFYVGVPAVWLNKHKIEFKTMKVYEVVVEVYNDKIVISLPKQKMDKEIKKVIDDEIVGITELLLVKINNLHEAINKRFEALKKVVGDYLELSSNIAIGSVKANLKNV